MGVPVVVLRGSTPRWEGVVAGSTVLTGVDVDLVLGAAATFATLSEQRRVAAIPCPYGDGATAQRVVETLVDEQVVARLRLCEPSYVGKAAPV